MLLLTLTCSVAGSERRAADSCLCRLLGRKRQKSICKLPRLRLLRQLNPAGCSLKEFLMSSCYGQHPQFAGHGASRNPPHSVIATSTRCHLCSSVCVRVRALHCTARVAILDDSVGPITCFLQFTMRWISKIKGDSRMRDTTTVVIAQEATVPRIDAEEAYYAASL